MFVTARQLDDLHKSAGGSGRIVLPYRAKLTPLAVDFVRARKIEVGYSDENITPSLGNPGEVGGNPNMLPPPYPSPVRLGSPQAGVPGEGARGQSAYLWWSDGPAGPAKAAIAAEERQSGLSALPIANDEANLLNAIRTIAREIKSTNTGGGILLVKSAARAALFANRCPSIRAVLGTCMETVEQGVDQIAANVLIIEHPYKTLSQIRNLLSRFLRRPRKLSPQIEQQLKELASCG